MKDTAQIEITLYKPNHKPVIGEVINFVTKHGEYCFGIYSGSEQWLDWTTNKRSGTHWTTDVDWWWYLPKVPNSTD